MVYSSGIPNSRANIASADIYSTSFWMLCARTVGFGIGKGEADRTQLFGKFVGTECAYTIPEPKQDLLVTSEKQLYFPLNGSRGPFFPSQYIGI